LIAYGTGGVAVGFVWLAIGYGLWSHRAASGYREAPA
jgi:hypothetical protein